MKVCPKCGSQMNDTDLFCQTCGMSFGGGAPHENPQQPNGGQPNNWQQPAYHFDPYDHTAEFDAKDISDNKVIAMLCYLLGAAGVIIALLGSQSSPYQASMSVSRSSLRSLTSCSASSARCFSGPFLFR